MCAPIRTVISGPFIRSLAVWYSEMLPELTLSTNFANQGKDENKCLYVRTYSISWHGVQETEQENKQAVMDNFYYVEVKLLQTERECWQSS